MNNSEKRLEKAALALTALLFAFQFAFGMASASSGMKYSVAINKNSDQPLLVDEIPDSLTKGAHAVVQYYSKNYTIMSESSMKMEVKKIVTVLNSAGDAHGYFTISYDDASSISGFKASVYDKNNDRVLKYRKGDLMDFGLSPLMNGVTDARMLALQVEYPSYPYTVVVEYKKSFTDLFDIQDWQAVENRDESVLVTELNVTNESGIPLRHRLYNMDKAPQHHVNQKDNVLHARIENIPAFPEERFSQPLAELSPSIKLALLNFSYDGHRGGLSSWKELGDWIFSLSSERDNLPPNVCRELKEKSSGLSDNERIKLVYEYMQERSRYVSIQLGLGGWQPFETGFVHEKGYGDCKALSFYTKSLLECVGIEAKYTLVYAGKGRVRIDDTFPANQFNHVILCVPQQSDTVWLECTDMNQPFNYLGSFTHNRKALIIEKNASELVQTPSLGPEKNIRKTTGTFELEKSGDIEGSLTTKYEGLRYDEAQALMITHQDERIKDFYQSLDFAGCSVQTYTVEELQDIGPAPVAEREVAFSIKGMGKRSGNRMFLKPNVANTSYNVKPGVSERVSDVVVETPKWDIDSIRYVLPEGFTFEHVPDDISTSTNFGKYDRKIYANDSVLTYVRKLKQPAGNYPASDFKDFAAFRNAVAKADQQPVVLIEAK